MSDRIQNLLHAISRSIKHEWQYWVIMPFGFDSIGKIAESSEYVRAAGFSRRRRAPALALRPPPS